MRKQQSIKRPIPTAYVEALKTRSVRWLRDCCGLDKETVVEVRKTGMTTTYTLERLNKFFGDLPVGAFWWEDTATDAMAQVASQRIALEGWPLFHHIRTLFLSGQEDQAMEIAYRGMNASKAEQWSFAGWGFLYVAYSTNQPEYFAGAARRLIPRFKQESCRLSGEQLFLMAADVAKFAAEYGQASVVDKQFDGLIELFPRIKTHLDLGQQASTWRGYGTIKASLDRFNDARRAYQKADDIHAGTMESRAGNFYRIAQLALRDSRHDYERQLDMLWHNIARRAAHLLNAGSAARDAQDVQQSAISQPTLLNAILLNHSRPESKSRPRQFQDRLDEFAQTLTSVLKVQRAVFQNRPAMNALAREATNPETRSILFENIRPQIESSLARCAQDLLEILTEKLKQAL